MNKIYWLHCGSYDFPTENGSQLLEFPGNKEELETYLIPILSDKNHPARNILKMHFSGIDWTKSFAPFPGNKEEQIFQIVPCEQNVTALSGRL